MEYKEIIEKIKRLPWDKYEISGIGWWLWHAQHMFNSCQNSAEEVSTEMERFERMWVYDMSVLTHHFPPFFELATRNYEGCEDPFSEKFNHSSEIDGDKKRVLDENITIRLFLSLEKELPDIFRTILLSRKWSKTRNSLDSIVKSYLKDFLEFIKKYGSNSKYGPFLIEADFPADQEELKNFYQIELDVLWVLQKQMLAKGKAKKLV